MKAAAIAGACLLAFVATGAMASFVPARFLPDVSLLGTVAAALLLGPGPGLLVAVALGLSADVLTGTLLGQQAMARLLEFTLIRLFAAQLDLRRGAPLAVFGFCLSLVDAAIVVGLSRVFLDLPFAWSELGAVLTRAAANGVCAPIVGAAARGMAERFEEREARREMRLDTRRPVL